MTVHVLGLAVCVLVAGPWLDAQTESLAGVANKAAGRRESASGTTKTYTNADLQPCREEAAPDAPIPVARPATPATDLAREEIVREVGPAVGTIQAGSSAGTGFFVAPGVMLTNKHVIDGGSPLRVRFANGTVSAASVIRTARDADLALVRVDTPPADQPLVTL